MCKRVARYTRGDEHDVADECYNQAAKHEGTAYAVAVREVAYYGHDQEGSEIRRYSE